MYFFSADHSESVNIIPLPFAFTLIIHSALSDISESKETEKELLQERVERRKRQMEMLNEFDGLVAKRIKTLKPEDLDADGAMDLLERSAKLDSFITGADKENAKPVQGELSINFVDSFKGV